MKPVAFLAAALLSFPAASFAVDSSPRCDALPAAEKDQCLKDELAKTDSKPRRKPRRAAAARRPRGLTTTRIGRRAATG